MQTINFTVQSQKIQWSNPTRAPVEGSVGEVYAQFFVDSEWEGRTITVVFSNEEGGAPLPEPILWTGDPVKVPASVLVDGVLRVGLVGIKDGKTLTTRYMDRGVPVYRSGGTGGEAIDPDPALWEQVLSAMGNLAELDTFDKSSLVAAINEVYRTGGGGGGGMAFDIDETLLLEDGTLGVNPNVVLMSDRLNSAIEDALAKAKESGAFDGEDGAPGKDGTSVTITKVTESSESGGVNTVEFSDGNTLQIKNGKDGQDGKTPVKGTDYWTADDQSQIVNDVLAALPTWNGGSY